MAAAKSDQRWVNFWLYLAGVIPILLAVPIVYWMMGGQRTGFVSEGGPLEVATVFAYFICIAMIFFVFGISGALKRWPFLAVLSVMIMRELDLDKSMFTEGVFKYLQYVSPEVPFGEKVIAAAILLLVIVIVLWIIYLHTREFFRGLFNFEGTTWCIFGGIGFTATSKLIDGLQRKLTPFGIELTESTKALGVTYEEVCEFGIPVMFTLALISILLIRKNRAQQP